jgi:two-component system alkaline phosphatase synthesis response regulator PhoP
MSNFKDFLLILEDEEALAEGLLFNFQAEGFEVHLLSNGTDGVEFIAKHHTRLCAIILDLMLPQLDGYEVLKRTRKWAPRLPILVLSAKSLENERILALELGADDYVTKPFSLFELILRVKRLVQKHKWQGPPQKQQRTTSFGTLLFDPQELRLVTPDGLCSYRISPTEGLLIEVFLANQNKTLTRTHLLQQVWQYNKAIETRTVDVFVAKLRKYIEKNAAKPRFITSVRGVGYRYTPTSS